MRRLLVLSLLLLAPSWTVPAHAQGFFRRVVRPTPAPTPAPALTQRVPELILIVKTDADERKRVSAAEELHNYDARTYTEIVPVLVDVAQNDAKASVRQEALNSLARIRPITPAAGQALERAAAQDDNWRIRLQAKSALMKYHVAGYTPSAKTEGGTAPRMVTTAEPPLLDPPAATPAQYPAAAFPATRLQTNEPPAFPRPANAEPPQGPSLPVPR